MKDETNYDRRNFMANMPLFGASMAMFPGLLNASTPDESQTQSHSLIPKTSADHLNLYRKVTASLEDNKEAITTFSAITYGVSGQMTFKPLHRVNVAIFTRTVGLENGSVRFMSNIIGVYSDIETGKILTDWKNPYTEKTVKAWHQVNGPLNYILSPERSMGLLQSQSAKKEGFKLPVKVNDQSLVFSTHYASDRKNPIRPDEWPLESSGDRIRTAEYNDWIVPISEIADTSLSEARFEGSWVSIRPWRPFMQMGQAPGFLITPKLVNRLSSINEVDRRILDYGEKHFPELLGAPKNWSGKYKSNWEYFKEYQDKKTTG